MEKSVLAVSSLVVAVMILGVLRGSPRSRLLVLLAVAMGGMMKKDPAVTETAINEDNNRALVSAGGLMMREALGTKAVGLLAMIIGAMSGDPRPGALAGTGRIVGGMNLFGSGGVSGDAARAPL